MGDASVPSPFLSTPAPTGLAILSPESPHLLFFVPGLISSSSVMCQPSLEC